ncbi:hypothetical protein F5X68DRAFT_252579 [Plectosphaerella plurivora]|uniref:Chitin-binding type-4 domain-containing protein n=1 Tax=Plectosphaerella plurivora TaxID=936078 RepID=A0A9P9ACX3_9PEZI|nr:hypothetical protein F5X68DRAFT_252579 [Plectosphaerella plurivora]
MLASLGLTAAFFAAAVSAHGNVLTPEPRQPGPAMVAACGQANVNAVLADPSIPLENFQNVPATCKLDLCRGATFADNTARVQTFTAGQQVPITVDLPIPHEGPCNVSVVDTRTNTVLGAPLIEFATYADENLAQLPANNTAFTVTIPQMQAGQCVQPGACTMQWFWFGTNAQQTYESCIDFVMA